MNTLRKVTSNQQPVTRRFLISGFWLLVTLPLFAATAWSWTADDVSQFKKANASYRQGQYNDAVAGYKALIEKHPEAAILYYNLGNSYHRLSKRGEALLAYERARLYSPRDADIEGNLAYVRGLLEYRVEDKRNWYFRAGEKLLETFTVKEVNMACLFLYFLFIISWSFSLFSRREDIWDWRRKTLLVLTAVSFVLVLLKQVDTSIMRDAIIMSKEAEVRYGPSENDQVAFRLGEGLKVHVMDHREDWSRVVLVNGDGGWVNNDQIDEVL
jgi:tetratricopeptide (TPR) repeat protein